MTTNAIAYLRTSSAANTEGDSPYRQNDRIMSHAARADFTVVACFWDAAVSGADPIDIRPGFSALLDFVEASGVKTVLVDDADRFARDLVAQEIGVLLLLERGVTLLTASGQEMTSNDDPTKVLMRQIAGAFAQYEKARLVLKLKGARDRKSAQEGQRIEGRKGYDDTHPELVREAKRLARKSPKTGKARTLREIAAELAALGYKTSKGTEFSPSQVQRLLAY